jgi:hypothetical protein
VSLAFRTTLSAARGVPRVPKNAPRISSSLRSLTVRVTMRAPPSASSAGIYRSLL